MRNIKFKMLVALSILLSNSLIASNESFDFDTLFKQAIVGVYGQLLATSEYCKSHLPDLDVDYSAAEENLKLIGGEILEGVTLTTLDSTQQEVISNFKEGLLNPIKEKGYLDVACKKFMQNFSVVTKDQLESKVRASMGEYQKRKGDDAQSGQE